MALPDDDDLPAVVLQRLVVTLVALLVAAYLLQPKRAVGLWDFAARRVFHTLTH